MRRSDTPKAIEQFESDQEHTKQQSSTVQGNNPPLAGGKSFEPTLTPSDWVVLVAHVREAAHKFGASVADRKHNPELTASLRQKSALMKSVLEAMPELDREILKRFYIDEQPEEDICLEMDLTEAQFRGLISRAKTKFGKAAGKRLSVGGIFPVFMRADPEPLPVTGATPTLASARSSKSGARPSRSSTRVLINDPSLEIFMAAAIAFQNVREGKRWLTMPNDAFDRKAPVSEIDSDEGRRKILNELALIEHGMF